MRRVLAYLLGACVLLPSALSAAPPRQVVEQVATTIEREYFDAERGRRIAAGLRAAADRGELDRWRQGGESDPAGAFRACRRRSASRAGTAVGGWAGGQACAWASRRGLSGAAPSRTGRRVTLA